ncbi:MAG: hypothetical protein JST93_17445 [Acidobacteria bacterium]|nr:hypothetical protein [Acidobacteriota bacterium]
MEQKSHRLLLLFAVTTVGPAIALGWLGWRLVEQDRALEEHAQNGARPRLGADACFFGIGGAERALCALEKQRVQERREHAADLAAAGLGRKIGELEAALGGGKKLPEGVAVVVLGRRGAMARAGLMLPFVPVEGSGDAARAFARAEELEYGGDQVAAIPLLRELTGSAEAAVRGGAWLRLARVYRKRGEAEVALQALGELAKLENVPVDGVAAGLLAAQGRALLLEAAGRKVELRETASVLDRELREGRWMVSRTTFAFAREQVRGWLGGGGRRS